MLNIESLILLLAFGIPAGHSCLCQNDMDLIYAEIILKNNKKYEGHLRWGKDKVMWNDLLYTSKSRNTLRYFLSGEEIDRLNMRPEKKYSWNFLDLWDPEFAANSGAHFKVNFGSIRQIEYNKDRGARMELKNGIWIEISDDLDMNDDIYMYDRQIGRVKLRLRDMKRISFYTSPAQLPYKHGDPIYGTVRTNQDTYTGFILWNNECCLTDFLRGRANNRIEKHLYGDIISVEKMEKGFLVTFRDGKEKKLWGTDDLNRSKLKIIVKNKEFGHMVIEMDDIESVSFEEAPDQGPDYSQFGPASRLAGRITTTEKDHLRGKIIYDLDEAFDCEVLDGEMGDCDYLIPFNLIKKIRPLNENMTEITLNIGTVVRLSGHGDVNDHNRGCLVETAKGENIYIPWKNILEINF